MKNEYLNLVEELNSSKAQLNEGAITDFLKRIVDVVNQKDEKPSSLELENKELKRKLAELENVIREFTKNYPVASLRQHRKPSQQEKNYVAGIDDDLSAA